MKMTMYELLGMVKDGKAPKKIKYKNLEYYLYDNETYLTTDKTRIFDTIYFSDLNIEVEILEEPKGISEKLEWCKNNFTYPEGNLMSEETADMLMEMQDKINEILDYLESKGDE